MKSDEPTLEEMLARAASNPDLLQQRRVQQQELDEAAEKLRIAEVPLVEALRDVGVNVGSAWDMHKAEGAFGAALPVLIEHLRRPYPSRVRQGIARSLTVPAARPAWAEIVDLYVQESDLAVKDALAGVISVLAEADKISDVIALSRDRRHGASRMLLLHALDRSKDPKARATLMELGTDSDLRKEANFLLRRSRRRQKKK